MKKYRKTAAILVLLCFTALSLIFAVTHASGGTIEGRVTDPKGAVVVGAAITVTDPLNNQTFTAATDQAGRYKIAGLPPGTYSLTISAPGFSDGHRDGIKIEEGTVETVDLKLEIAPVEAAVTVPATGVKPNSDSVYQQLR